MQVGGWMMHGWKNDRLLLERMNVGRLRIDCHTRDINNYNRSGKVKVSMVEMRCDGSAWLMLRKWVDAI